ncbi:MAG: hypothetical protein A3F17_04880 [Gammaproteobacteria bacterium RIFCSPHIGHO2_12_FULL_41_15]|nr:MAG: hypothetical protein A3F17_04880 [Gammaproteobacteria bacterium RIFCSPHIGHO2_12_FULL_41_15]
MTTERLDKVTAIHGNAAQSATIIWLHGLGADGHDFESLVPFLQLPNTLNCKFIFPHAPIRPVTANNGMQMRAWFDLDNLQEFEKNTLEGLEETQQQLLDIIEEEIAAGILAKRIALVGFSQGGTMALLTGLSYPQKLAGIMGLSTFLPASHPKLTLQQSKDTPIFIAHGNTDYVLPFHYGKDTYQQLLTEGFTNIAWHEYPMSHDVCQAEIKDISAWLQNVLK